MSIVHQVSRAYKDDVNTLTYTENPTGNSENNLDDNIPGPSINTHKVISFTRANLQSVMIYCTVPCTLYTNNPSGSSPQDTIPLLAGQVLLWTLATDGLAVCPFSGNVTGFYITVPGSVAGAFKFRSVLTQ